MDQAPAHSPIGASGYHRWKHCPGSVREAKTMENISSDYADEGTEAHDLACAILTARQKGKPEPDLFGLDDGMVDHVFTYVDHMMSLQRGDFIQLYEHRFHLKKIHPLLYGTADGVTYYPEKHLLVISDLKYGAGVYVDVERNEQLLYYATGAVISLGWAVRKVRIEIIQPRITYAEAIRPWECDIFDIWDFAEQLKEDALATMDPSAPLRAGDWCQFCPAAPTCPLLQMKMKIFVTREQVGMKDNVIEQLAADLGWLPILEKAIKRKREYAYAMAERGETVPGWKLVKKRGHRFWKNKDEAAGDLVLAGIPRDMLLTKPTERELLSPAQIEALPLKEIPFASKNQLKKFVADLTDTKSSGHKLVPQDADGEEVKVVTAKTAFSARRKEIAELT